MNRKFSVRPRARLDLAEASDWYDEQRRGLGGEFLRISNDHRFDYA